MKYVKPYVFLSTPSARRATERPDVLLVAFLISIHALREEGDSCTGRAAHRPNHFYPRPPRGGRPEEEQEETEVTKFLSTPSARRATRDAAAVPAVNMISIHALREEGDCPSPREPPRAGYFYPRPPRGGRQRSHCPSRSGSPISIHALREEGDPTRPVTPPPLESFLSTPSARRATLDVRGALAEYIKISIHALREEGDKSFARRRRNASNFYPRPPRGGRRTIPVFSPGV